MCYYKLYLQFDVNKFYLAPRNSLLVEEAKDFEQVSYDSACGCSDNIKDRTWNFTLYFRDCNLQNAWILYNRLGAFLVAGCAAGDMTLNRQVCNESLQTHLVSQPQIRMVDTVTQFLRQPILKIDFKLQLDVWPPAGVGEVVIG